MYALFLRLCCLDQGVVFNEMKGVYSQPDSVMNRVTQEAVFPNNTYNVDSGGDPVVIPDLTFEKFQVMSSCGICCCSSFLRCV